MTDKKQKMENCLRILESSEVHSKPWLAAGENYYQLLKQFSGSQMIKYESRYTNATIFF
jgi:hypothetical protein